MTRDGTRWRHPGEPILPLITVDAFGAIVSIRCIACRGFLHRESGPRESWRHHPSRWTGARKPFRKAAAA